MSVRSSSVDDLNASPILIYGPRKAGTTLLQNVLDGGEEVFVYPVELKLKELLQKPWPADSAEALQMYRDCSGVSEIEGLDFPGFEAMLGDHKQQRPEINSLRDLICWEVHCLIHNVDAESKPEQVRSWAAKEVGGNTVDVVRLWRNMFFRGRVLMIIRKPLMVTRSVLRERRRRGLKLPLRRIYKEVVDPHRVLSDQIALSGDPKFCFVAYEQLTGDTESSLKRICNSLGIEYTESFKTPSLFRKSVVVRTSSQPVQGIFSDQKPWYSDLTIREICCVAVSLAVMRALNLFRRPQIVFEDYSRVVERVTGVAP